MNSIIDFTKFFFQFKVLIWQNFSIKDGIISKQGYHYDEVWKQINDTNYPQEIFMGGDDTKLNFFPLLRAANGEQILNTVQGYKDPQDRMPLHQHTLQVVHSLLSMGPTKNIVRFARKCDTRPELKRPLRKVVFPSVVLPVVSTDGSEIPSLIFGDKAYTLQSQPLNLNYPAGTLVAFLSKENVFQPQF